MPIERKCPTCKTWNREESHCIGCGAVLDPELLKTQQEEAREEVAAAKAPDVLDKIYNSMRYSRWWLVRGIFWIFYSVWFVLFSIISFFLAFIAVGPG